MKHIPIILAGVLATSTAFAEAPKVVKAIAHPTGMGWDFEVTLSHGDSGWDHYADGWEVVDEQGNVLGTRILHHPHVEEQPFTRSLRHVMLTDGTREVFIRVKCSKDGWSDSAFQVSISR